MASTDQTDGTWRIGSIEVEKKLNIPGVLAVIGIGVLAVKGYWRLDALEQGVSEIKAEQAEGKDRADERQAETQKVIDEAVRNGRAARESLEARVRTTENNYAGLNATLQAIGGQLTGIGSDVRDLRQTIEGKRQ